MTHPLVSILIPVYNVQEFLPQCIDSVLEQTYSNLQIVLMDDGSSDLSLGICHHYAHLDKRVEVYHHENQGVAITRNRLLEKVKGNFVLFVDSDDWIEPDMVACLIDIATIHNADLVNCEIVINDAECDNNDKSVQVLNQEEAMSLFLQHRKLRGSLCNKLLRVSILHNVEFLRGIFLGEDALFCWDLLQHVETVVMSNQHFYHYRMVDSSLTHSQFGPRQFTAYTVWSRICDGIDEKWPKYSDIARARFCIEMTLLLRSAIRSRYPFDSSIKTLLGVVKEYGHLITKTGLSSILMRLYGIFCRCFYPIMKLFG